MMQTATLNQNSGSTAAKDKHVAFSDDAAQYKNDNNMANMTTATNDMDDQQLQLVMTLTQTINSLGGRFEEMGQTFEAKLA